MGRREKRLYSLIVRSLNAHAIWAFLSSGHSVAEEGTCSLRSVCSLESIAQGFVTWQLYRLKYASDTMTPRFKLEVGKTTTESLILAQDERWRRA